MTDPNRKAPTIPCPGSCNNAYRRSPASALWREIVHEVRYPTDEEWDETLWNAPRLTWGDPVWCEDDGAEVGRTIRRLPELAAAAWAIGHDDPVPVTRMVVERTVEARPAAYGPARPAVFVERLGCGHIARVPWSPREQPVVRSCSVCALHATTSSGRLAPSAPTAIKSRSSVIGSPSGSPSWDQVDEVVEWLTGTEAWLRALLGESAGRSARGLPKARDRARVATASMRYLHGHHQLLLAHDVGGRVGRQAIALAARVEKASGRDNTIRLRTPCPMCDLRTIVREDGDDIIRCRNARCGASWRRTEFNYLVRGQG